MFAFILFQNCFRIDGIQFSLLLAHLAAFIISPLGAPINNHPRKTSVYLQWQSEIMLNFAILCPSVRLTYPANFVRNVLHGSRDTTVYKTLKCTFSSKRTAGLQIFTANESNF